MTTTITTASALSSSLSPPSSSSSSPPSSCGIYLSESTIPNAGLGMFAGQHYAAGTKVTDGDIVIPILDFHWNNNHNNQDINFLWENYAWTSGSFQTAESGRMETDEGDVVSGASPGIGAAVNCIDPLVNVEPRTDIQINNGGLHRSTDPGVGAFTPYYDRWSYADVDIPQGQELFVSYGPNYFLSREDTYGLLPSWEDYEVADELLIKYLSRVLPQNVSEAFQRDLWTCVTTNFPWPSRTINALPTNVSDLDLYAKIGTGKQFYNQTIRDITWLEDHGKCVDNIVPGPSTIPQAGRGAFAKRFIPKGGFVTATPLIHITDKSCMVIYDEDHDSQDHIVPNVSAPLHRQLLVNYCFGHANSSILLSPYGMLTSLINHSSETPNTRIQWSSDMPNPEWLNLSLAELDEQTHAGLMLDFVALRDIQVGEEVLIDYGKEWQDAWNDHVRNWKPGSVTYIPAYELDHDLDSPIRTIHEEPYSDNVLLYVYEEYRQLSGFEERDEKDYHRCRVLDRYDINGGETVYMVELFTTTEPFDDTTQITYYNEVLFQIPRDAFFFSDVPYTRDHHLYSSFRREAMIPDDIFPTAWVDR